MEESNVLFAAGAFFVIALCIVSVIRFKEGREVVSNETFWVLFLLGAAVEIALAVVPVIYRALLNLTWQNIGMIAGLYVCIKLLAIFDRRFPVVYHRD